MMLQESGVPQVLKVSEMIDLFRSYYPSPMPTARVVELAGLQEKAGSQNKDLSGGQRQRLYFALAICGDPDIIFLDEPTVGPQFLPDFIRSLSPDLPLSPFAQLAWSALGIKTDRSVESNFAPLGAYAIVFFALAVCAYCRDTSLKFA